MYRAAVRLASRRALDALPRGSMRSVPRRFASTTSPADKTRSWKSSGLRWALAIGAVYYYNTASVFADEAPDPQTIPAPPSFAESELPTVEAIIEEKRKQSGAKIAKPSERETDAAETETQPKPEDQNTTTVEGSPEALEEEAAGEGAFNPETGEINWDCPCLGGMAHGPCGEEFKTAFSCFVFSTNEPKGMDCIDKFQDMQTCFRKYPDVYGGELTDDELPEDGADGAGQPPAPEYQSIPETAAGDNRPEAYNPPDVKPVGDPISRRRDDSSIPETAAGDIRPDAHNLSDVKPVGDPIPRRRDDSRAANHDGAERNITEAESKPTEEEKEKTEGKQPRMGTDENENV